MTIDQRFTDYMVARYTPELTDPLTEAMELMSDLGVEHYKELLEEVIMVHEVSPSTEQSDSFFAMIKNEMIRLIEEFNIYLNDPDTVKLSFLNRFLRAVVNLENIENKDQVRKIKETETDDLDQFFCLLQLVDSFSEDTLAVEVNFVERAFLDRVYAQLPLDYEPADVATEDYLRQIKKLKAYKEYAKSDLLIFDLIKNNIPIGLDYVVYYKMIEAQLETLSHLEKAREFIGMFLLSKNHKESPVALYRAHSDSLVSSLVDITAIDSCISKESSAFESFLITTGNSK